MESTAALKNLRDASAVSRSTADALAGEVTMGEIAAEFGVTLRALRFYEDRGLLHPRREGAARLYSAAERLQLKTILKGKQLGFTLAEIADLIGKDAGGDFEGRLKPQQIVAQIDHLERQRREIDDAITRLHATHARLVEVSRSPDSRLTAPR
jgi:DNA-binding transcriptional MerR regulator